MNVNKHVTSAGERTFFIRLRGVASYWTRRIDVFTSSRKRMRDLPGPLAADFRHAAKGNVLSVPE